jgi:hypothetical protein
VSKEGGPGAQARVAYVGQKMIVIEKRWVKRKEVARKGKKRLWARREVRGEVGQGCPKTVGAEWSCTAPGKEQLGGLGSKAQD